MKRPIIIVCSIVLLVIAAFFGTRLYREREDPAVAHVLKLQQTAFEIRESASNEEEVEAAFVAVRKASEELSDEQRTSLRRSMRESMQQRMTERIHAFHQLPTEERDEFLDAEIDRMESRRRRRPDTPNSTRGTSRNQRPGGEQSARGPGRRQRWANMSEEDREQFKRKRLDNTTAQQRAEFASYIEALQARRKARGLPDRRRPF